MKSFLLRLLLFISITSAAGAIENPQVKFITNKGEFIVELFPEQAPITVANFTRYVNGAFYDGLIFHRVVNGFIIQTGGYNAAGEEKKTLPPILNESSQKLRNKKWTIAMARQGDPNSATSQFYINTNNNKNLDVKKLNDGYTVFGRVIKGINVIKAIERVEVSPDLYLGKHRPVDDVIIVRARVIRK
jgi:cyclophilin family peptidyl-prolyl cis-trans isomerase